MSTNNFRDLLITFGGLTLVAMVTHKFMQIRREKAYNIVLLIFGSSAVIFGTFINLTSIVGQATAMKISILLYIIWILYFIYGLFYKNNNKK
jgi:fatty acid desaturase